MKKLVAITAVAAAALASSVAVSVAGAAPAQAPAPVAGSIAWSPCPDNDPFVGALLKGLECGSLQVPLDHGEPDGEKIAIALTRYKHTSPDEQYQGVVLLHRGQWPGSISRDMPTRYAKGTTGLATDVGPTYDWIGFDPRGVGGSEPLMLCDTSYVYPGHAHPDTVPANRAEEREWVRKAKAYAKSCGDMYGDALKHMSTKDVARDLDLVRQALGQEQINYLGYDWGGYLGAVYASMYPDRVRRMVLDSLPRPGGDWYENNLDRNVATEKRAKIFFAWVAKHDSVYHLGTTQDAVEANYYEGRTATKNAPIDGKIGPHEYHDVFEVAAYRVFNWPTYAKALSEWVVNTNAAPLKALFSVPGIAHQNRHATTNAVQCTDSAWPRDWDRWHKDYWRQYNQGNTFMTWNNAWYNAPCAFWPVKGGKPQKIGDKNVDILIMQPENDVAHGPQGGYETHKLFKNSRLVFEVGGNHHSPSLSAYMNACLNTIASDYFRDGTRPDSQEGVDATCAANPEPVPPAPAP